MLITEWNIDEAIAVNREEAWTEGREEGREEGIGIGYEHGREEGYEQGKLEFARNALSMGLSVDAIHQITGLDIDTIKSI